jgi:ubiquinone biosynthesis protein COQ9
MQHSPVYILIRYFLFHFLGIYTTCFLFLAADISEAYVYFFSFISKAYNKKKKLKRKRGKANGKKLIPLCCYLYYFFSMIMQLVLNKL